MLLVASSNISNLRAQTEKEKLQLDKQRIEKEISLTQELLNETQKSKQISVNQLALLVAQVKRRSELLRLLDLELQDLDRKIQQKIDTIGILQKKMNQLKEDYARMIVSAHRQRNAIDRLMFIFSSSDFNQAYRRMRYFQQYGNYRKWQAERITEAQQQLGYQIAQLELMKKEKLVLKTQYENEKRRLSAEQAEQNQSIKMLLKKEKELLKKLRENERALRRLQAAIEEIIAAEMRKSSEAAKAAGRRVTAGEYALTPEEKIISGNFAANRGALPWPTERGIIAVRFGEQPHPVLKGIKTQNNGIDIFTNEGSTARVVFDGVVTNVLSIPSLNNVVIVRHGEFLTVYSNLDQVFVEKGAKVTTKEKIGRIYTDADQQKTKLHFEIWKGKELLDPEQWIAR